MVLHCVSQGQHQPSEEDPSRLQCCSLPVPKHLTIRATALGELWGLRPFHLLLSASTLCLSLSLCLSHPLCVSLCFSLSLFFFFLSLSLSLSVCLSLSPAPSQFFFWLFIGPCPSISKYAVVSPVLNFFFSWSHIPFQPLLLSSALLSAPPHVALFAVSSGSPFILSQTHTCQAFAPTMWPKPHL